jgi:hypothetical protein
MQRIKLPGSPRARWLALAAAAVLAPITVLSMVNGNKFELDGNALSVASDDWDKVALGTSSATPAVFVRDAIPPAADRIFTGGGSKDERDISGAGQTWAHTTGEPPDKNDIEHAFAGAYFDDNGDLLIYFGADRFANNGDSAVGFWFFQDNVSVNPDGSFSGTHVPGDILITSDFRNGGGVSVINVFKWVGGKNPLVQLLPGVPMQPGAGDAPACLQQDGIDVACAISNRSPTPVPATWPGGYVFKGGGNDGMFPVSTLFEGGVNITKLLGPSASCFSSFMAMTRTSASTTAQLKDFVVDRFPLCGINVAKSCNGNTEIAPSGDRYRNSYTVSVTNVGAGTVHGVSFTEQALLDGNHSCRLTAINGTPLANPKILMQGVAEPLVASLAKDASATATVQCDTIDNPFDNEVSANAYAAAPVQGQPLPLVLSAATVGTTPQCDPYQVLGQLKIFKSCANRYTDGVLSTPAVTMDADLVPRVCVDIRVENDSTQRVDAIGIVDDKLPASAIPAPFSLAPGEGTTFEGLCYTPDGGDDPLETNPGRISFSDEAYAEGSGALTKATVASSTVTATCKLCPTCPACTTP